MIENNKNEKIDKVFNKVSMLLLLVLDGKITAKDALDKWPKEKIGMNKLIDLAWHELYHFYSDEDIRRKDKNYAEWQIRKLRKIYNKLISKKN